MHQEVFMDQKVLMYPEVIVVDQEVLMYRMNLRSLLLKNHIASYD
jgi:hypothetical protein